MAKTVSLAKSTALAISRLEQPVISNYQLGCIVFRLFIARGGEGSRVRVTRESPTSRHYSDTVKYLLETAVLQPSRDFASGAVFEIFGRSKAEPADIACTVDPFCYLSHLSAMAYHGLTNRIPRTVFLTTPAPRQWRELSHERMTKDLGQGLSAYLDSSFPRLTQQRFEKIASQRVECHCSVQSHLGAYRVVRGRPIRVATIGRTFLDMLRRPDLCGGITHVLDVYAQQAKTYLTLIVDELETHGGPIDKVRAGYVLSERLGLAHSKIDEWEKYAQRGGSRKLDASAEYSATHSSRWCLSINLAAAEEQ